MATFGDKEFQRLPNNEESEEGTNQDPPQASPYQQPPPQPYYDDPSHGPHDGTNQAPPQAPPYQQPPPQPYYDDPSHGLQAWVPDTRYVISPSGRTMNTMQELPPTDWTIPAIISCIFCCLPLGLFAIIYANKANTYASVGNMVEARHINRTAKNLVIATLVVGTIIFIGTVMATVLLWIIFLPNNN